MLLQALTTFDVLFAVRDMSWAEAISAEWHNRNTDCYANALLNGLQAYSIGLAGSILS